MKHIFFSLSVLLAFTLVVSTSCKKNNSGNNGQGSLAGSWQQTNGPCNGMIQSIAITGNTVFAGADQEGMYISPDLGKSWSQVTNGTPPWSSPSSTVIHHDTILAVGDGLFRSTDQGLTWTRLGQDVITCCEKTIAWSGNMIVVNTYNYGPLFISNNNGVTWTEIGGSLPSDNFTGVTILSHDIFVATYQHGVFKSTDNGQTFIASNNGLTSTITYSIEAGDTRIYAGTGNGLFVSNDHGANWSVISNTLLQGHEIFHLAISGSTLLAGGFDALFYSTDNGVSWTQASLGINNPGVLSVAIDNSRFLAGTNSGVYFSSNSGQSWAAIGLPISFVRYFSCNGSDVFSCANGIFVTPDYGVNWTYLKNGMPIYGVYSLAWNGSDILAATDSGVYVSADRGLTWTKKSNGIPVDPYNYVTSVAGNGTNLYAGTFTTGLYVSHDGGNNWTKASLPGPNPSFASCMFINSTGLFAGTCCNGILFSPDNGQTWTLQNTGLPANTDVMSITQAGSWLYLATGQGVYGSGDNGSTWVLKGSELYGKLVFGLAAHGTDLFAATADNGIYMSTNQGSSWFPINDGLPPINAGLPSSVIATCIAVNGSWLFVGTHSQGAWRHPL